MPDMTDQAFRLDLIDGDYDLDSEWRGMIQQDTSALTAAAFPIKPPADWFGDPGLRDLTPLTIDNTGRVFGHIAAWHTSHIGLAGGVRPPKSKSNYAFFRTGTVETDEGDFVDVGQITLSGGHAPLEASVPQAVAHYDNTQSAIMDVAAGEDRYGIWVAGALRPDVTPEQVRAIRASSVSGDWRPINGKLELVAVCAVNCPGFPIPRARVASGAPIALVAAGVEPLIEKALQLRAQEDVEAGIQAGLVTFRERISLLERAVLADAGGPSADDAAESLRRRVRGDKPKPDAAALRARVRGPEPEPEPEPEPVPSIQPQVVLVPAEALADIAQVPIEAMAASLRERVHPF